MAIVDDDKLREACAPGEFPDCGCHYTTDDDGLHFCPMHKAAPEMLKALEPIAELLVRRSAPIMAVIRPSEWEVIFKAVKAAKGKG